MSARTDVLVSESMGYRCSKSIVLLDVKSGEHKEEDMVSVLKELVMCIHGNRNQTWQGRK